MQPASTVAKDNREYEKELASTSGPQSQVSLTFGSPSPGFPGYQTDPPPDSHLCHTSYHTPLARHTLSASLPSHTFTTPRLPRVTELKTAKQQIQAELKLHVKVKFDQLTDTVTSLTQKLTEVTKRTKT